ncbi:zinc-dependent metalloprotease [Propionimicrobium sp. PCR01-08-3]|uniref:zinc-dependent metalloprotease n=1 Tax=Propionimicrobium sp. PCR01-08-3 TaxID=3052086 RepID=UPI00255C921F|nr:zinc-dependent metalloprotease [Propionimicrobium sp. PCR01-08-3]WIY83784.1 zinc-dependent metalloprotease [Propionimicrobium sp. PCR01-08-3]
MNDNMANWFAQFGGSGGDFDFNKLIAELQQAMAAMAGQGDSTGIDWSQAKATARRVTASLGSDPVPSGPERAAVAEADRLASMWLDQHIAFEALTHPAAAWSRAEWVENTMGAWRTIAEPIVTRIADALAASFGDQFNQSEELPAELGQFGAMMAPMLRTSAGAMYTAQLASAMGKISGQVVSGSEIGVQLLGTPQVVLLPTNVAEFSSGLHISDDDIRIYLAVREGARQRLFAQVGWLAPQILALLEHYAREITIDVGAITSTIEVNDLSSLTPERLAELSEQLQGRLFSPGQNDAQREILDRLETLLALVEGWVDEATATTVNTWMPHAGDALAEAIRRRRATNGPSQQLFSALVGLDLKPRRIRDAANLWAGLTRERGIAGRDGLWAHPDLMPTAADLDDPLRLLAPDDESNAGDEMDAELAKLLERAEQERRDDPGTGSE